MKETKINISAFQCRDVFVYQGRMLLPNKPRCNILTLHCYRHTKCSIQAGCLLLLLESDFSCLRCWPIFVRKGCCYLYVTCFLSTLLNKQIFKFFCLFPDRCVLTITSNALNLSESWSFLKLLPAPGWQWVSLFLPSHHAFGLNQGSGMKYFRGRVTRPGR